MSDKALECPCCRSRLSASACKKCGYMKKILKVVDHLQETRPVNYSYKIKSQWRDANQIKILSAQEKLSIYLQQYQKLIIEGVQRLIKANLLEALLRQEVKRQLKEIWQKYLLKINQNNLPFLGIFKKYLYIQILYKDNSRQQQQQDFQQADQSDEWQKEQNLDQQSHQYCVKQQPQQQQQQQVLSKKRGRPSKYHSRQPKSLSNSSRLRQFVKNNIKPLLLASKQLKKNGFELTPAQKQYLSFILGLSSVDQQFLRTSGYKYLKLILQIDGNKITKTFVKQSFIIVQLKRRNLQANKDRNRAILLIILFDILISLNIGSLCAQNTPSLEKLIQHYKQSKSNQLIQMLLLAIDDQKSKRDQQKVSQMSYRLIYSIVYLATSKLGLTISMGEVIRGIGTLEIPSIQIQQDLFLPAILNQQDINSSKARKTAHLLAKILELSFPNVISKWCRKWCLKFDILSELPALSQLNRLLFSKAAQKNLQKRVKRTQSQRYCGFFRFCELEQDIATLGSLLIYAKLVDGLSDYPYLIHTKTQLLKKVYDIQCQELDLIEKIVNDKQISVENVHNKQILTKVFPKRYRNPFDSLKFIGKIGQVNRSDRYTGSIFSNLELVRLRNSSHINQIPSLQLTAAFKKFKANRIQQPLNDQINLRFNQLAQHSWHQELEKSRERKAEIMLKSQRKPKAELNEVLTKQLSCIVGPTQKMISQTKGKQLQCLLDEPSTNYQLMYNYSEDNLRLSQRCQQLHLMQQLCLNVCTYQEIIRWINIYESELKKYETS